MKKKNITINDLATMINKGFEKTASIERIDNLEKWANGKFDKIGNRLNKIENLISDDRHKRIKKLESRVDFLENMIALPVKK